MGPEDDPGPDGARLPELLGNDLQVAQAVLHGNDQSLGRQPASQPAAGFLGGKGFDTEKDNLIGLISLGFKGRGADGTDTKIPPYAANFQPVNFGLLKMLAPAQTSNRLAGVLQETTKDRAQGPRSNDEITHKSSLQFSAFI